MRFPVFVLISLLLPVCANVVSAGTYGCTREVCAFRDALSGSSFPLIYVPWTNECVCADGRLHLEKVEFKDSGITIVGIAPDSIAAVKTFATKHNVTVRELRSSPSRVLHVYSYLPDDE